ncbi:MAG: UMP kinase [Phycisphaerales bacterium]|nr:UMP kinase [Phycisphaerales bacterium]
MSQNYQRVVLKLSGESFAQEGQLGIAPEQLAHIAAEIAAAYHAVNGLKLAIVVGGGNIVRGAKLAEKGRIAQATADYMGMMGTIINGLALREALEGTGVASRLMTALEVKSVAEPFIRARALRHMEKGRVIILAAGTGNPFFTTDTCASLRGVELQAQMLLKATKVDGVYTADPKKDPTATKLNEIKFSEAIAKRLAVMDLTALTMCMEHSLPVRVFNFHQSGNVKRAMCGEAIGTLVSN